MSLSLSLYSLTAINCTYVFAKENFKIHHWKQQLHAQDSVKRKGVWKILEYFMKLKSKWYETKVSVQPGVITSNATQNTFS